MNPRDYKYTKGHTWVKAEDSAAKIGITRYAVEQLGSIVFLEVADVGEAITQFEPCGTVESTKATSDIMSPVSGEVTAVNEEAIDRPEIVEEDPYGAGWLLRLKMSDPAELDALMSAEEFEKYIAE